MKHLVIYVHGKGGSAAEAEFYQPLFPDAAVIGFDYRAETPWEAEKEFPPFFEAQAGSCGQVTLIANSIGAFFCMRALSGVQLGRALFVSPIVDMETLIGDMMKWAGVTEEELCRRKEIQTGFGETLSWDYLCDVRRHPVQWKVPTCILYGEQDHLTARDTVSRFAGEIGARLTVMPDGEHWFHTEEEMRFLAGWVRDCCADTGENA